MTEYYTEVIDYVLALLTLAGSQTLLIGHGFSFNIVFGINSFGYDWSLGSSTASQVSDNSFDRVVCNYNYWWFLYKYHGSPSLKWHYKSWALVFNEMCWAWMVASYPGHAQFFDVNIEKTGQGLGAKLPEWILSVHVMFTHARRDSTERECAGQMF